MQPIDTNDFIAKRSTEISEIDNYLKSRPKKTMPFQKLPHYKRRRTASFVPLRRRRRKRIKHEWTFLHRFLAKRFKMVCFNGIKIPWIRYQKSDSLIHKGFNFLYFTSLKCSIFDINKIDNSDIENCEIQKDEKELYFISEKNNFNCYKFDKENNFQINFHSQNNLYFQISNYLIVVKNIHTASQMDKYKPLIETETVFILFKPKNEFAEHFSIVNCDNLERSENIIDLLNILTTKNYISDSHNLNIDQPIIMRICNTFPFMFLFSKNPKRQIQYLISNYNFISLSEYFRLSLEYKFITQLDLPCSNYREFEKIITIHECEKWWRTPSGKRKNFLNCFENKQYLAKNELRNQTIHFEKNDFIKYFIFPFKLPDHVYKKVIFFECFKGTIGKGARVYNSIMKFENSNIESITSKEKIIGYVSRSGFSYRSASFVGIILVFDDVENELFSAIDIFGKKIIELKMLFSKPIFNAQINF